MNKHYFLVPLVTAGLVACGDLPDPVTPRAKTAEHSAPERRAVGPTTPTSVIFSNFGPGLSFDSTYSILVIGSSLGRAADRDVTESAQFRTPPGVYVFARATVALGRRGTWWGAAGRFRVVLQADTVGRPGRVIEQLAIDSVAEIPAAYTVTSVLSPVLRDSLYWVTVAPLDNSVMVGWFLNATADSTFTQWASTADGDLFTDWHYANVNGRRGAFQIEGRPADKIDLCHRTGGDSFVSITVAMPALASHLAHGDGTVGGPVPHQPGMRFGVGCAVETIPIPPANQWHEQAPYPPQACATRPAGTTCIGYRDGYNWLVNDVIVGWGDTRVEAIGAIDTAIGQSGARYEHALGTQLVRIVQ